MISDSLPLDTPPAKLAHDLRIAIDGARCWHERCAQLAQPGALDRFLARAARTVPFYRAEIAPNNSTKGFTLKDFPPIDRSHLEHHSSAFISEDPSTPCVQRRRTGGTTRPALEVHRDAGGWHASDPLMYEWIASRYETVRRELSDGDLLAVHAHNYLYWRNESVIHANLHQAHVRIRRIGRSPRADRALIAELMQLRIPVLSAKPSCLRNIIQLSELIGDGQVRVSPTLVACGGETLYEDERTALEQSFGCPVGNFYLSAEAGFLAGECPYREGLHLVPHVARVLVRRPDGELCEEGTGELVITNLANWHTVLINYRTGDHVRLEHVSCPCGYSGPTIRELPGREPIAFPTSSGCVSTQDLSAIVSEFPVAHHQITKRSDGSYAFRWAADAECANLVDVARLLEKALRAKLGAYETLHMEYVSYGDFVAAPGAKMWRYRIEPQ